jgi:hypothetical protein
MPAIRRPSIRPGGREVDFNAGLSPVPTNSQMPHMPENTLTWTRITDPDEAALLLPIWFGRHMIGLRGRFGLLLTTGDVLRITSIAALHLSSGGAILLDVQLDHAGVPDEIDLAWRAKHYLGAPVPSATSATVNLAHVVAAIAFLAEEGAQTSQDTEVPGGYEVQPQRDSVGSLEETIERANEVSGS